MIQRVSQSVRSEDYINADQWYFGQYLFRGHFYDYIVGDDCVCWGCQEGIYEARLIAFMTRLTVLIVNS